MGNRAQRGLATLLLLVLVRLDYEPPFVSLLSEPDGTPNAIGRTFMMAVLLSVPTALVINLLPRLRRPMGTSTRFTPTAAQLVVGLVVLGFVLLITADVGLQELRPFVTPLGPAAFLGRSVFLLAVLALPGTVLLNRFPRLEARSDGTREGRAVMTANVMIGAALILLMIMLLSAFALEATACSVGVPNCD